MRCSTLVDYSGHTQVSDEYSSRTGLNSFDISDITFSAPLVALDGLDVLDWMDKSDITSEPRVALDGLDWMDINDITFSAPRVALDGLWVLSSFSYLLGYLE